MAGTPSPKSKQAYYAKLLQEAAAAAEQPVLRRLHPTQVLEAEVSRTVGIDQQGLELWAMDMPDWAGRTEGKSAPTHSPIARSGFRRRGR